MATISSADRSGAAAARDFTVKPLFAEPCMIMNINDAVRPKQVKFIKALKMNQISEELYLLDRPDMRSIAEAVNAALRTVAKAVMGIHQRLKVTQSWSLKIPPGVGMYGHTHSNSLISG